MTHEMSRSLDGVQYIIFLSVGKTLVDSVLITSTFSCSRGDTNSVNLHFIQDQESNWSPQEINILYTAEWSAPTNEDLQANKENIDSNSEAKTTKSGELPTHSRALGCQRYFSFSMNSHLASCAIQSCISSRTFCDSYLRFVKYHCSRLHHDYEGLDRLHQKEVDTVIHIPLVESIGWIDTIWCYCLMGLVSKRGLLDDAMAWLNTLGGGYSALGDYFDHHAEQAGKISFRQLKIALDMGDPPTVIRCKLYFGLSLMQRGHLKHAKKIIRWQYKLAKELPIEDGKLIAMCKGLWTKLKYLYSVKKHNFKHTDAIVIRGL